MPSIFNTKQDNRFEEWLRGRLFESFSTPQKDVVIFSRKQFKDALLEAYIAGNTDKDENE